MLRFLAVLTLLLIPVNCLADPRGVNPSYDEVNKYINETDADIEPELWKAILYVENNGWRQFEKNGTPIISCKGAIGMGQVELKTVITYHPDWNIDRILWDWKYNLWCASKIYLEKVEYIRDTKKRPREWQRLMLKYNLKGLTDEECAILAYNSWQSDHKYVRWVNAARRGKPWLKYLSKRED